MCMSRPAGRCHTAEGRSPCLVKSKPSPPSWNDSRPNGESSSLTLTPSVKPSWRVCKREDWATASSPTTATESGDNTPLTSSFHPSEMTWCLSPPMWARALTSKVGWLNGWSSPKSRSRSRPTPKSHSEWNRMNTNGEGNTKALQRVRICLRTNTAGICVQTAGDATSRVKSGSTSKSPCD